MIGHMDDAGLPAMIVAAKKVILAWRGKMRGGMKTVLVPAYVGRLVIKRAGIRKLAASLQKNVPQLI